MGGTNSPLILFVNHWARSLGGAELSLLDLLTYLSPRCNVHLVTSEPGVLVDRARECGATCHLIPCSRQVWSVRREHLLVSAIGAGCGLFSFFLFAVKLAALANRIGPDLVHANVPKSHIAVLLAAVANGRFRHSLHMREIFPRHSLPWLLYLLLGGNVRTIAISKAVWDALPARMRTNAVVIHNGIAVPPAVPERRSVRGQVSFVYLGRVVPWKGCHVLVAAFSELIAAVGPGRAQLSIVGDTLYWPLSYREELRNLIRREGMEEHCRLLPHTDRPYEELMRHDVFCTASEEEPFGRSVAEAQACGLPVVAFRTGGIPEIVTDGESGFLVLPGDAPGLGSAMRRFIEDLSLAGQMGKCGRRRTETLFNREIQMPKLGARLLSWAQGATETDQALGMAEL